MLKILSKKIYSDMRGFHGLGMFVNFITSIKRVMFALSRGVKRPRENCHLLYLQLHVFEDLPDQ